jgi:hypothetical protein
LKFNQTQIQEQTSIVIQLSSLIVARDSFSKGFQNASRCASWKDPDDCESMVGCCRQFWIDEPYPGAHLTPKHDRLMAECRVLSLKPQQSGVNTSLTPS